MMHRTELINCLLALTEEPDTVSDRSMVGYGIGTGQSRLTSYWK